MAREAHGLMALSPRAEIEGTNRGQVGTAPGVFQEGLKDRRWGPLKQGRVDSSQLLESDSHNDMGEALGRVQALAGQSGLSPSAATGGSLSVTGGEAARKGSSKGVYTGCAPSHPLFCSLLFMLQSFLLDSRHRLEPHDSKARRGTSVSS